MTAGHPIVIHARGIALEAAADDIQLMPPGTHDIQPMGEDGKPVALTVQVDAATAEALEAARARYQAEADAGTGDAPYIDFNHEDGPAAAWVKSIYWAGEDPKTGGVRAKVEWSQAGREAVEGKTFRRFSPSFSVDAKAGRIIDAPVNMGGLVNRAAFRTINAFFAQDQSKPANTPPPTMTEDEIAALKAENESLKQQVAEMSAKLDAAAQAEAESLVAAAAEKGSIPADDTVKAKWVKAILTTPETRELLAALPANEALKPTLRLQAKPGESKEDNSPTAVKARYDAMPDGADKDKFRRENAALLLAASRQAKS